MARKGHGQFWHRIDRNGLVVEVIGIRDNGYVVVKRMKGGAWRATNNGARSPKEKTDELRAFLQQRVVERAAGTPLNARPRENGEGWYDGEPARDAAWRDTKYNYAVAQRIMREGADTIPKCGCRVESDGKCEHGGVSRLVQWWMI